MAGARDSTWIIAKEQAEAEHGMVASLHPLASAAGLEILKAGGNAVDAAVATAFAVGVVEPFMSGVGGVAAMVFHQAATGRTVVVDGSSTAPLAAREDTFELAPPGEAAGLYGWRGTVGNAQNEGFRSPIVPGMPGALLYGLERYGSGKVTRRQVLASAIRLAEEGFPVDPYVASTTAFELRKLRRYEEAFGIFFQPDGTPYTPGSLSKDPDRLTQPDLGRTLRALAEHGAEVFYQGDVAEQIARDIQAHGGLISREDLAAYRPRVLEPLEVSYRGVTVQGIPKTSGCVTAYETLNLLEQFDLAALGQGSAASLHLIAEASRRAFQDRFAYLADPDKQAIPFEGVLSKAYAAARAATIDAEHADPDAGPGDPWAYEPGGRTGNRPGGGAAGDGCTTHLTVVDAERNVVSLTSTLGELFGSAIVPKGTGVLLNNGMTWFNPEPGTVNSIEPGKRILWAPTPTIVLRDGRPILALGAPGGRRILTAVVQSLVNVLDYGLGVQEAVSRPRIHSEGPATMAEERLGRETLDGLAARGQRLKVIQESGPAFSFARPNAIAIDARTGRLTGGVNQFTPSAALGY